MAFKDEERSSGIISGPAIMRKVSDKNFDEYIEQVKGWTPTERLNAGRNTFAQLVKQFQFLWDQDSSAFVRPMIAFVNIATEIGCAGLDNVSESKKNEVASYFQDLDAMRNIVLQREDFFDYKELDDDGYRSLVEVFLCASLEPLNPAGADYTNILFSYMLLVACADQVNENGIMAIKRLRADYFDYAPMKKAGIVQKFQGSFDKSIFMSPEQLKAAEETEKLNNDFKIEGDTLVKYKGTDVKVNVPYNLRKIASRAFVLNDNLASVNITPKIETIGEKAFMGCHALKEVTLPDTLREIQDYGFANCERIAAVDLPKGLTTIGECAFINCEGIRSLVIPEGIKVISSCAFQNCSGLERVVLPEDLTTIEQEAFAECSSLKEMNFPASLASIGHDAFRGCDQLPDPPSATEEKTKPDTNDLQNLLAPPAETVHRIEFDRFFSVAPMDGLMVAMHKKEKYEKGDIVVEIFNTSFGRDVELKLFGGFANGIEITVDDAMEFPAEKLRNIFTGQPPKGFDFLVHRPDISVFVTQIVEEGVNARLYNINTCHGFLHGIVDLSIMSKAEADSYHQMFASALPIGVSEDSMDAESIDGKKQEKPRKELTAEDRKKLEEHRRLKKEAERVKRERINAKTRPKDRDGKERASMADAAFFLDGLTEQEIKDWKAYFKRWSDQYDEKMKRSLQEEAQKYFDKVNSYDFDQLKEQLNPCVKTRVQQYEQMVAEAAEAVEEQSERCQNDTLLLDFYWTAMELSGAETFVITVEDGKNEPGRVLNVSTNVEALRRRFQTDRVKKLLQEKREQALHKLDSQLAEVTEEAHKNVAERVLTANRAECRQKVIKYLDRSIDRLQSQLTEAQQQRSKTFVLMFGRRKELQQNIDELTKQLAQYKAYRGKVNAESDAAPSAGLRALYVLASHRQPMKMDDVVKSIADIPGETIRSALKEAQEGGAVSLTDRLSIDESCYLVEQSVEPADEEKEQYQLAAQKQGVQLPAAGNITDWREVMISKLSGLRKETTTQHTGSITVNPVTKRDKKMASLKDDILYVLSHSRVPMTISEIMATDSTFDSVSNLQVAAMARRLVAEGKVQRVEEDRKAKFFI